MKHLVRALGVVVALGLAATGRGVTVIPEATDELLANPGTGWQTFHCFADEDKSLAGLPSGVAYFRFYWDELEPKEGAYAFEMLDGMLEKARKAGQTFAFRVMCAGTDEKEMYVPEWLRTGGCPGFEYGYGGGARKYWVPDMDSPRFLEPHLKLIRALGKRYDGHPDLDHVDVGSVGLWAEWHMSDTGVEMPSPKTQAKLVDAWMKAFPRTPVVVQIGCEPGMQRAERDGLGWRADCLGDMGGFSKSWNHMTHYYRQQLDKMGAESAWKRGPVAFESCWDMRKWAEEKWDIRFILDYALDLHASVINNKSAPIPEGTRGEVERVIRRLGYRLVLKGLEHPEALKRGIPAMFAMRWENAGVAPPYRNDVLAFRLSGGNGGPPVLIKMKARIRGWMPGETAIVEKVTVPRSVRPGSYALSLALLDSRGEPRVRLAIKGRGTDGWYEVSRVRVE